MVKWEYRWAIADGIMRDSMNGFGADGWELFVIDDGIAYFKRPVKPQMPATLVVNSNAPVPQLIEELKDALREHGWGE